MPIFPLPQFEADVEADRKLYETLKAPKSMVVRFGFMKLVGEYPYDGDAKPGCGSKIVVKTHRGIEIGEMLTSTCPNSGCSKSVSRKEMLQYIDNSGGKDYPFFTDGRVLRVASGEDMDKQSRLEQSKHALKLEARRIAEELGVPVKIVEAEPILGGEKITFYYASEDRMDLGALNRRLGETFRVRIDLKHVGARDEARLTADYEKCGQYCCCKNFLKVLKPVSMKSAKIQKATLDPLKISGRCGRLMCCLRYEDQTYDELRKRLPNKKKRVGTPHGDGFVADTQILTQLVLVQLDVPIDDGKTTQVAVPVEDLTEPISATAPPPPEPGDTSPRSAGQGSGPQRKPMMGRFYRPSKPSATAHPVAPGAPPEAPGPDSSQTEAPVSRADTTSGPGARPPARKDQRRDDRPGQAPRAATSGPGSSTRSGSDDARREPQRGPSRDRPSDRPSNRKSEGGPDRPPDRFSERPADRRAGGPPSRGPNTPPSRPTSNRDDLDDIMRSLDESDRPRRRDDRNRPDDRGPRNRPPSGPPRSGGPPAGPPRDGKD